MSDRSRIPSNASDFDKYIKTSDAYQLDTPEGATVPNYKRFLWTDINSEEYNNRRKYWADTLYPVYSDPLRCTSVVKNNVEMFIKEFKTFATPLLNLVAASPNSNSDDEAVFDLVLFVNRANPTHPEKQIADKCNGVCTPLGGGDLKLAFRTTTDTGRPALVEGADSVHIKFTIYDQNEQPPTNAGLAKESKIVTAAQFIHQAGLPNVGKKICYFAQWYNTRHPNLAGNWSDGQTSFII